MWQTILSNAPVWILIVGTASLSLALAGLILRLRERISPSALLAEDAERKHRNQLYSSAIDWFAEDSGWIHEAANGQASERFMSEDWFTRDPYTRIQGHTNSLTQYWRTRGGKYRKHHREARRLEDAIDQILSVDAMQDRTRFEAIASDVLHAMDQLIELIHRDSYPKS